MYLVLYTNSINVNRNKWNANGSKCKCTCNIVMLEFKCNLYIVTLKTFIVNKIHLTGQREQPDNVLKLNLPTVKILKIFIFKIYNYLTLLQVHLHLLPFTFNLFLFIFTINNT